MNHLPPVSPEVAASREDFELFRRLLRVARLLNADNFDALCSESPALTAFPQNAAARLLESVPQSSGPVGPAEGDDGDEEDDDYSDSDGDDDEDENGFSPQPPKRKRPSTRQSKTRAGNQGNKRPRQYSPERPHAVVEKRYRSMVNSKIQQLHAAIPPSNAFTPTGTDAPVEDPEPQKMPTKSVILDRGIQYLNHLISTYDWYDAERNELRAKLKSWLEISSSLETAPGNTN